MEFAIAAMDPMKMIVNNSQSQRQSQTQAQSKDSITVPMIAAPNSKQNGFEKHH